MPVADHKWCLVAWYSITPVEAHRLTTRPGETLVQVGEQNLISMSKPGCYLCGIVWAERDKPCEPPADDEPIPDDILAATERLAEQFDHRNDG
jgi:hypothetical protein